MLGSIRSLGRILRGETTQLDTLRTQGIKLQVFGLTLVVMVLAAVYGASLAPLTLTWYASTDNYPSAILFNAMMFFVASLSAQLVCFRLYRPLIARNPNHRYTLIGWVLIYAFVGIQMGWVLRPFIGSPGSPVRFFREGAWGNA